MNVIIKKNKNHHGCRDVCTKIVPLIMEHLDTDVETAEIYNNLLGLDGQLILKGVPIETEPLATFSKAISPFGYDAEEFTEEL